MLNFLLSALVLFSDFSNRSQLSVQGECSLILFNVVFIGILALFYVEFLFQQTHQQTQQHTKQQTQQQNQQQTKQQHKQHTKQQT